MFDVGGGVIAVSDFGIGIDNFQIPLPVSETESIGVAMLFRGGSVLAGWDGELGDGLVDVTADFAGHTRVTLGMSLDVMDRVVGTWDFGADGTVELTSDLGTLGFIDGRYTGSFQLIVPEPGALGVIFCGAVVGLLRREHQGDSTRV